jgi:antirestriction protein ArdC/nucleoside-triphosphatase THEP1
MTLAEEFNSLNGIVVTRKDLEKLLEKAEKERHTIISKRIIKVLHAFADDTFLIELQNLVEPYGLNGVDTDDVTGLLGGLEFIPESEDVGLGKPVSPNEIYDMVTQRMIDLIKDANKGDYKRAWKEEGYLIPYNFVSKKAYRGVNVVMLSPLFGLLDNPYFLTFNQIQEKGGKIRKGSHGHKVVYFSSFNKEYSDAEIERLNEKIIDNKLEKGDEKTIFFLKYYNVFNGADIEGIDFDLDNFSLQGKVVNNEMETGNNEKIEIAEAIVKNYPKPQPEIKFTGSRAFYQPANDFLSMPDISKFKTSQDFYRTYFHELSHSTGHESRLKRGLANEFGSPEYAFEELIAEFGAVFLSAQAGIMFYTNKNHAGYLKGWNEVLLPNLENDNRFLMKASSQAQKASDYILQPDAKGDFLFMKGNEKQKAKKGVVKVKPTKKVAVKTVKKTPKPKIENEIGSLTEIANGFLSAHKISLKATDFKESNEIVFEPRSFGKINVDGLLINYNKKTKVFEVAEMQAGKNEEEIWVYLETKQFVMALKELVKGNNRKPKKIIDMSVKPKSVDKKANPTQAVTKKEKEEEPKISGGQYALFGAVKGSKMNRNSLAYKLANKPKNVSYFKIDNTEIASFLGQIERKKKESIVISLTGGQGSMKTRMAFQFMNALAQNYKVGHASIEEHPESNLYFDKAEQYLNAKALNNIEAPEVKSVQELEQLIKKNDVIVIDSFTKMQEMHKGFEVDKDLRKKYDGKLFIVIFQQTTDGKMRGGSKSQFDADIVLFTEKKTDYRDNYIYADKNRYQDKPLDGLKFNIFNKKLVQNESEVQAEPTTKKKLSFSVN